MQSTAAIRALAVLVSLSCSITPAAAKTAAATFGEVVQPGGAPSDVVLDEARGRLYIVNSAGNRVDVYNYAAKTIIGSIPVGQTPLPAMSMDGVFLYVANSNSSSLSAVAWALESGR